MRKSDFVLFMTKIINCSAQTSSRTERIKTIVKSAEKYLDAKRMPWERVRDIINDEASTTISVMGWSCIMVLIILQWNARSLIANGQEFKKYVEILNETPNIICIQETWLVPRLDFVIKGYTSIRRDREIGKGGGIFIQRGLQWNTLSQKYSISQK